jgi:hypothetical protein
MSNRSSLFILMLIALFSWSGLLLFTYLVPARTIATVIPFFLILAVALTSTVAPIAYMIAQRFSPLPIVILIAPLSWGALLLYPHLLVSHIFPASIPFFLLLAVALTSTVTPTAYIIARLFSTTYMYQPTVRSAIREAALSALIVVLNLTLRTLSSWNLFTAILIVLAVIVVEVMAQTHK